MPIGLILYLAALAAVATPRIAFAGPADPPQAFAARVLELTNVERSHRGLAPLAENPALTQSAQAYAEVLALGSCFGHTCGPVPDLVERIERSGYTGWIVLGENIAAGQQTPERIVALWMASPDHRANILNPVFTEIGVGIAAGGPPYGIYWSQAFGGR